MWDQIKGQDIPVIYLRNRVKDGSHPNAIYISGKPGSGKSTLANIYTKSVLDPNRPEGSDCLRSREAYDRDYANLTYHLVRDSSSTKEAVERLSTIARSKPILTNGIREDQYRRFIVLDEVELIHPTTFSMLLNPLEYSPPTTTWILISMEPDKLPAITREAIESRCKELRLNSLSREDIASMLNQELDNMELSLFIARFSNGNARKAWSIAEVLSGSDSLSLEGAENYLLQSARTENRVQMWKYLSSNNVEGIVSITKEWPKDRSIVGPLLIEDLVSIMAKYEDAEVIPVLRSLQNWISSKVEYPLEAALMSCAGSFSLPSIERESTDSASFKDKYERWLDAYLHK